MDNLVFVLYPIMAVILIWMWRRVRGRTLADIMQASADVHHDLADVFNEHPYGGTAREVERWVSELPRRTMSPQERAHGDQH